MIKVLSKKSTLVLFALGLLLASNAANSTADSSDWKLYGAVNEPITGDAMVFYNPASREVLPNKNVRVWVKGLAHDDIQKRLEDNANNKIFIDDAAKKLASNYIPPVLAINKIIGIDKIDVIINEEIASKSNLNPTFKALYEINCKSIKIRALDLYVHSKDGRVGISNIKKDWSYISPESNANNLRLLLCNN